MMPATDTEMGTGIIDARYYSELAWSGSPGTKSDQA